MTRRIWVLVMVLIPLCVPPHGYTASFDCAKASSRVEKLICSNPDLSKLDESLATTYTAVLRTSSEPDTVRRDQKGWLKQRDACPDVNCLRWYYDSRLAELTVNATENLPGTWPKLIGGTHDQCADALAIAKNAFKWSAPYLVAPAELPPNLRSVLVLKPEVPTVSGGDGLEADAAVFDKVSLDDGTGPPWSAYWQKAPTEGQRVVVLETPAGWRGSKFSTFALKDVVSVDAFRAEVIAYRAAETYAAIVSDSWRPPLIFREMAAGRIWFINVGQPHEFLPDWRIRGVDPTGVTERCAVRFRPMVREAALLLPPPLRILAQLLDATMGPGNDEGTLQPTANLRISVKQTWANAALRPWAVELPYNTREEVDAGLTAWARTGASYRKVYQSIQRQYPLAEDALTEYYRTRFHKAGPDARTVAIYVLDIALRSHYAFPSNHSNGPAPQPNPWKDE